MMVKAVMDVFKIGYLSYFMFGAVLKTLRITSPMKWAINQNLGSNGFIIGNGLDEA